MRYMYRIMPQIPLPIPLWRCKSGLRRTPSDVRPHARERGIWHSNIHRYDFRPFNLPTLLIPLAGKASVFIPQSFPVALTVLLTSLFL